MPIGHLKTEGELLAFIRRHVEIPQNLQGLLAGGFLKLATAADDKIAYGTGSVTFTASPTSATTTIAHGLKATPVNIQLTSNNDVANCFLQVNSKDATNFVVVGRETADVNRTGDNSFYWLAIA